VTKLLLAVAAIAAGCGDNIAPEARVAPEVACAEQAEAWCDQIGYATYGCRATYVEWCGPIGHRLIAEEAQIACLAAIDEMTNLDIVPDSCVATWLAAS
jgi:hypothetical protein